MYGWRARVGLIIPSTNTVNESEFGGYLPSGVSLHTSRMRRVGGGDVESLVDMAEYEDRCAELLQTANVDVAAYGCTVAGMLEGPEYDLELETNLASIVDAPVVATSAALRRALETLALESISIATPYIEESYELEREHFEDLGYDVVSIDGLGIERATGKGEKTPADAYNIARDVDSPEADGVVISCTDFRTFEIIETLESDLGKPVISSNSATLWNALRAVGVDYTELPLGTLFEE